MRAALLGALAVWATACAVPKETVPFEEAMGWGRSATSRSPGGTGSPGLQAALVAFEDRVQAQRVGIVRGAAMGEAHQAVWTVVLEQAETSLAQATAFDCARGRLVLERELETDARLFGDIPQGLAERIQRARVGFSTRLAAWQPATPKVTRASLHWPLDPVEVTSPFGGRPHPIFGDWRMHAGVDLLAEPAQDVFAAAPGLVTFAGWNGGHGKQVVLQHDAHLSTSYSHLEEILVEAGQSVGYGTRLGFAGQTGRATGVHLHFELRRDGEPVDPELELPAPLMASAPNATGPESPPGPSTQPPQRASARRPRD